MKPVRINPCQVIGLMSAGYQSVQVLISALPSSKRRSAGLIHLGRNLRSSGGESRRLGDSVFFRRCSALVVPRRLMNVSNRPNQFSVSSSRLMSWLDCHMTACRIDT